MAYLNNPLLDNAIKRGFTQPQEQQLPQTIAPPSAVNTGPLATTPATPQPAPAPTLAKPKPLPMPQADPGETALHQKLHQMEATGPGWQQIHNKPLKVLAGIGNAIASGFFPNVAAGIPGTSTHHQVLLNQAQGGLAQEQKGRLEESQEARNVALANKDLRTSAIKPDIHGMYAAAVGDAQDRGVNPKDDSRVQQILAAMTATTAKEPTEPRSNEQLLAELIREEQKAGRDPSQNPKYRQLMQAIHETQRAPAEHGQLNQVQRGFMRAAGGDPDKEETWTPDVMQKFRELSTEKPPSAGDDFAQFYGKWLKEHGQQDNATNEKKARAEWQAASQAPERPPQTMVMIPGPNGTQVPTIARPGVPLPGTFETTSGVSQGNVKTNADVATTKAALTYAQQYQQSGNYTGPGDEALLEKFFELAKPSSGFRMTQAQMDMLIKSRSWMDSAQGIAFHAKSGVWFPPDQRKQIVDTMSNLGAAKGVQGTAPAAGAATQGTGGWSVKVVK